MKGLLLGLLLAGSAAAQGTVPVMMLSDLHFDPTHDPAKVARLAAAPVEAWDAILKEPDAAGQAASFEAVQKACGARGVDTDFALLEATLQGAREHAAGVGFVTVTGDLLVHGFECRYDFAMKQKHAAGYAEFAEKTAVYVVGKVEGAFPAVPVYVADGNNDSSCGDYRMDSPDQFLAATSAAELTGLRDVPVANLVHTQYDKDGSFAVNLKGLKKTRLVVLDDIYLSEKYTNCAGTKDEAAGEAELAWLDRQLTGAQARGEQVWVMGHIPPGVDAYSTLSKLKDVCAEGTIKMFLGSDRLTDVLVKHADVVKLALFAHTHSDEVRVLGGKIPVKLVGSISPVNGNRPTFTVAQVDAATATLKDYTVFEASNATGIGTTWAREYSFRDVYKEPDFSGTSVKDLVAQLQADGAGSKPASEAYENFFTPGMMPLLSLVWPQYACALNHTTEAAYKACVCKGK